MTTTLQEVGQRFADGEGLVASAIGPTVGTEITTFQAAPPSLSLLSAARDLTAELDGEFGKNRWLNGISFEPEGAALKLVEDFPWFWSCPDTGGTAWTSVAPGAPSGIKQVPDKPTTVAWRPFTLYAADPCISTMGINGRDADARATRLLEANLPRIVENEFWTGTRATSAGFTNPSLQKTITSTLNGGGATGYVSALADLEQALADGDNIDGFIHAERRVITLWDQNGLLIKSPSGRSLTTINGTTVVGGVGYPGTNTSGAAASRLQSWAYATGPVAYARTPVRLQTTEVNQRILRTTQDYITFAEAEAMAFWDGKIDAAILVNHTTALS